MHKETSISFIEQLIQNLGNFIFFISAAIIVGPEQYGLFSIFYIGSQLIYSFSVQWILLPITSKNLEVTEDELISSIKKKLLIIVFLSVIFCITYGLFVVSEKLSFWEFFFIFLIGNLMILYDILRYFLIRVRKLKILIFNSLCKYVVSFSSLFIFYLFYDLNYFFIVISLFLGFLISFISQFFYLREKILLKNKNDNDNSYSLDAPLMNLSFANIINTSTTTVIFNKIDVMAFGALQAFRSIVNFFPIILQFMETHISAIKVLKNETNFIKHKWLIFYLIISIIIGIFLIKYNNAIISIIYGRDYESYSNILTLLFFLVTVQNLSRIYSIEVRLKNIYSAFNFSSYVLYFSTLFLIILYFVNLDLINYKLIILIMILTSVLQLLIFIYAKYIKNLT